MILALISAVMLSAPAADAQQGRQDECPVDLRPALGIPVDPAETRAAIEAAQAHPLGSRENPVRVCGPRGERAYIARLRCADGTAPRVGQRGSIGQGPFGTIVDLYPLDCGNAAPGRFGLAMDMYHGDYVETRAPPGFTLVP